MIREKSVYYIVPYNEIIYISSSGRNSVIHTPGREYVTGVSISSMTERLPADRFLRIHKQYTINIQYTSNFSYYSGGQYILYLKDEEKTNLPVGKVYAEILKERIKFR
jgi:DNA-binding LytR/AlgR family response regulator